MSTIDVRLGLRVRFRDLVAACAEYDGPKHGKLNRIDRSEALGYDMNVFEVTRFNTDVTVQWQDLSLSEERSTDLIPDTAIDDEHAAWPGEIAHTTELVSVPNEVNVLEAGKVGVIQSVNPTDRTAKVAWCPDGCIQYTEDIKTLLSAIVGRAGTEQEELSLYDLDTPALLNVRRGDIVQILDPLGIQHNAPPDPCWVAEVVDTRLDGYLVVRTGAADQVRDIAIPREQVRVAVRSDGTDQADAWDEAAEDEVMDLSGGDDSMLDDETDTDTSSEEVEEEQLKITYEDENGESLDASEVENGDWESEASQEDIEMAEEHSEPARVTTDGAADENAISAPEAMEVNTRSGPEQYAILGGEAPRSSLYEKDAAPKGGPRLKRIQKEHKILSRDNMLPDGVYVRSWESRLDVIRVLFVGPSETPYAHIAFVVDLWMGPDFPAAPPEAFFHSWKVDRILGGVGRVNPNLYEDGKICLSLLGTWSGEKSEGWSPTKSTLLQVLVSILGLVLVREPYFNEAGYEALAGLESSKRPSAIYNERATIRASQFLIKAMELLTSNDKIERSSIAGLEDVLAYLYRQPDGRQLLKVKTEEYEKILQLSEDIEDADGLTTVSKGACIPLRRVVARLKQLCYGG